MALFEESVDVAPARRPPLPRGTIVGMWALVVALAALLVLTFLPTSFVIQRPGPVYNTLGEVATSDGAMVPLISVEGATTYPTDGALDLLTVETVGNRERTPSWFELAVAWLDPARAVLPIEAIFPQGQTTEERNEQSAAWMVDSQQEATAAALTELGYDVQSRIEVYDLTPDSASEGILEAGDVIRTADGEEIVDGDQLRSIIKRLAGAPVPMTIQRGEEELSVSVTPNEIDVNGVTTWLIGVTLTTDFTFPFDVTIQLDNVGGPSAGMMFALGIVDTLTEGELNGGEHIAGTGTIDAAGRVGPIGGIRQKLYGARDAGADYFLAPRSNCGEVYDHVPEGLHVFAVQTLDDALAALDAIATEGNDDLAELPTCTAADVPGEN